MIHYHLRPGGIRRIIELALPHIVRAGKSKIASVVIATGEAAGKDWCDALGRSLGDVPLDFFYEPSFRYFSELRSSPDTIRRRICKALQRLFPAEEAKTTLVWAHNLGLARNLILAGELSRITSGRGITLLSHHHDFWFENRWARCREMAKCGFGTLPAIARAIFRHRGGLATINRFDMSVMNRRMPGRVFWMPNLAFRRASTSAAKIRGTRRALAEMLGDDGPVWLVPTRFLRRKNLAEAVLLARWLRPGGWVVTTAGVSSRDEQVYARRLSMAAKEEKWRVRFCLLEEKRDRLKIDDVIVAAEVLLLTSVQEGFGLPYLEAAAAGKPLIARELPNVSPDLRSLGFAFPQLYEDIFVHQGLFNRRRELARQRTLWKSWKTTLPAECRSWVGGPPLEGVGDDAPIPFSRLTLSAQLEVLRNPPDQSWAACGAFNPMLQNWRTPAASGKLKKTVWSAGADSKIGGRAYARRFHRVADGLSSRSVSAETANRVQWDFIRQRLASDFLYPILLEGR